MMVNNETIENQQFSTWCEEKNQLVKKKQDHKETGSQFGDPIMKLLAGLTR